jgi:surface carbohydrate biosynthesis protein
MREVDVAYFVELVARELDVACAVKEQARARHGLEVEVLPVQTARSHTARNLRARVLALPYAYRVKDPYTRRIVELFPGAKILNLAWEQVLYRAFEAEKSPSDAFTRDYVLHHAWSGRHRDRLVKAGVPDAHVLVNGNPAYGLYDPPYRHRCTPREELARRHGLDPDRRWCLFAENYGWAFNAPEKVERLVAQGMPRDTVAGLARFCESSLRTVIGWLAELARSHGFEVIVRPRPSTFVSDYARFVEGVTSAIPEHLRLIKDGPVRDWILASDVVTSSYSTSLIEAALAGKSAFMVMPEPLPEGLAGDWYHLLPQIARGEDFLAACRAGDASGSEPLARWARREFLANGDPIRGLAALLARIADPAFERPPLPPRAAYATRHHGWRALPHPGDGALHRPYRVAQQARYRLRRWRDGLGAREGGPFELAGREVPASIARWVDPLDLFDSRDVDRITREWQAVLA